MKRMFLNYLFISEINIIKSIAKKLSYSILILIALAFSHKGLAQKTWNGTSGTNWHTSANWTPVGIPGLADDVIIAVTANDPIIGADAVCKNITINTGTSLTTDNGINLDVYGDFINNGTFTANTSSVTFLGGSGYTLAGTSSTTFYNLEVNKLAKANTITSTSSVFTTTNLTLTQGNLILTNPPANPINVSYVVTGDYCSY